MVPKGYLPWLSGDDETETVPPTGVGTFRVKRCWTKVAETDLFESMTSVTTVVLPLTAPDQDCKIHPVDALAVSVTMVPRAYLPSLSGDGVWLIVPPLAG